MTGEEFQTELACYNYTQFDTQWNIQPMPIMDLVTGCPLDPNNASKLGFAHLQGREACVDMSDVPIPFDARFPFHANSSFPYPTPSEHGVRSGDTVTVIVCGTRNGKVSRKKLHVKVISVTSFGLINGVANKAYDLQRDRIFSFPITCVLGVNYGKRWKQITTCHSSQQSAKARAKTPLKPAAPSRKEAS